MPVGGAVGSRRETADQISKVCRSRLRGRTDALRRDEHSPPGKTALPEGPFEVTVTAYGSAGTEDIVCHLALDVLRSA